MENYIEISGRVLDRAFNPIKGATVTLGQITILTDNKGRFKIETTQDVAQQSKTISVSAPKYSNTNKNILKGDNSIMQNLGPIILKTQEDAISEGLSREIGLRDSQINSLIAPNLNFEQFQQKKLNDFINIIKKTLIPFVLSMLISFGITSISQALKDKLKKPSSCPDLDKIQDLIRKRNKLVKQLNSLFTIVDVTLKSLGVVEGILILVQTAQTTLLLTPIPTPPIVSKTETELTNQIKKYRNITRGTISILNILRTLLSQIIGLLESLDFKIQSCSQEDPDTLETLTVEINKINQSSPPPEQIDNVNGFTFDIETEPTTNDFKRKRAVAKNPQDIILLRGEYSYSSSEQILIDELIFYIKTNDLKAD